MIYYVISDLHLMDGGPRDDALPHLNRLLADLQKIPAGATIVLPGDVVDIQRLEGDVGPALKRYQALFSILESFKVIWIIGNHDHALVDPVEQLAFSPKIQFVERAILDGLYYCHGQEFDLLTGRFHRVGAAVVKLANILGALSPGSEDWIERTMNRLKRVGRHAPRDRFARAALDFVRLFLRHSSDGNMVKGIVAGHTHQRMWFKEPRGAWRRELINDEIIYCNTGSLIVGDGFTVIENGVPRDL